MAELGLGEGGLRPELSKQMPIFRWKQARNHIRDMSAKDLACLHFRPDTSPAALVQPGGGGERRGGQRWHIADHFRPQDRLSAVGIVQNLSSYTWWLFLDWRQGSLCGRTFQNYWFVCLTSLEQWAVHNFKVCFGFFAVLGIESRAVCTLGTHVTTELRPQPCSYFSNMVSCFCWCWPWSSYLCISRSWDYRCASAYLLR
jgi:hypothetical protein